MKRERKAHATLPTVAHNAPDTMDIPKIKTLTLTFDGEIARHEVPLFRGAVIASMGGQADVLYHNHSDEEGYRYSYPLIQYKRIRRKAAIVCLNEGADIIGQFLSEGVREYQIGDHVVRMSPESLRPAQLVMQTWQDEFHYSLRRWLPLNSDNYRRYQAAEGLSERIALLEGILKANILSMAKGLGITVGHEITVTITTLSAPYLQKNKGTRLMAFDLEFRSNFSLPDFAGLGKNASIGFGVVTRRVLKENTKQ